MEIWENIKNEKKSFKLPEFTDIAYIEFELFYNNKVSLFEFNKFFFYFNYFLILLNLNFIYLFY